MCMLYSCTVGHACQDGRGVHAGTMGFRAVEHSSKITQHHAVKVYGDWELQSTVGVQTVLSAKWAATPGALLVNNIT